jgi:hypothetical protein
VMKLTDEMSPAGSLAEEWGGRLSAGGHIVGVPRCSSESVTKDEATGSEGSAFDVAAAVGASHEARVRRFQGTPSPTTSLFWPFAGTSATD